MSKLMWIAGIFLVAAGAALGAAVLVSPALAAGAGVSLEAAAILLVGGILSLGLGGVISLMDRPREILSGAAGIPKPSAPAAIPEFGRKAAETAAVAVGASATASEEVSAPTRDAIMALEQARRKIEQAFENKPADMDIASAPPRARAEAKPKTKPEFETRSDFETKTETENEKEAETEAKGEPEADVVALDVVADLETGEETGPAQLYVVEERFIHLRPARILSDGTVEAETGEGWMRFENLEHLDEYLDAMEPMKS